MSGQTFTFTMRNFLTTVVYCAAVVRDLETDSNAHRINSSNTEKHLNRWRTAAEIASTTVFREITDLAYEKGGECPVAFSSQREMQEFFVGTALRIAIGMVSFRCSEEEVFAAIEHYEKFGTQTLLEVISVEPIE